MSHEISKIISESIVRENLSNKKNKSIKSFKCDHCEKSFTSKVALVHHSTRNFKCGFCEKDFPSKRMLQIHENRVHCKSEIFNCNTCNKSFPTKASLRRHINRIHQNTFDSLAIKNSLRRHTVSGQLMKLSENTYVNIVTKHILIPQDIMSM